MRRFLAIAFLLACCAGISHAQIITAADCTSTQIQNAFNLVTASTTTVIIPACPGGVTWTVNVSFTVPSGNTNLTIQGQSTTTGTCGPGGTCTATDNTVILDGITGGSIPLALNSGNNPASFFRVTGITIKETGSSGAKSNGLLGIGGSSQNIRVDHNHFDTSATFGSLGVYILTWQYGVVDHNVFDAASGGINNGIHINMDAYNNKTFGYGSWADATNFGTSKFIFVENNAFNYGFVNDCQSGGRQVFRYNLILEASAQTHPTEGGSNRGCRASEFYHNEFDGSNSFGSIPGQIFFFSSGTGLIWGNTAPTGYKSLISLHSMRRSNSTYNEAPTPTGWGYCGTDSGLTGAGSNWDQNLSTTTGQHCIDQPGEGVGDLLVGQLPADGGSGLVNSTTGTIAWPHEALEPTYEWLDSWAAVPGFPLPLITTDPAANFVQNSEYYQSSDPGSGTDCTGFTGATGVGCGVVASRPGTCTTGVAYWGTDTNTLYKCTSTNTWTAYYTPYTYPHPLTNATQANPPSITPASGTYSSPQTITMACSSPSPTIYYTTNGTTPTHGSMVYSSPFSQSIPVTVMAICASSGLTDSTVTTNVYTLLPSNNPPAPTPSIIYIGQATPQAPPPFGNWQGLYGKDGYWLANSGRVIPPYATVSTSSPTWTWAASSSDPRATQVPGDGRIAACWYSGPTLSFDVNYTDGKTHPFSLYALDWDGMSGGRNETITLSDAVSGKVLDTRTVATFQGGEYLTWNCSGHFIVKVTSTNSANSTISAVFFG